jgi:hypothetical protein
MALPELVFHQFSQDKSQLEFHSSANSGSLYCYPTYGCWLLNRQPPISSSSLNSPPRKLTDNLCILKSQFEKIVDHLITPCTFPRSGWSVVRSASLAKGGTSIKKPSPHLHKVPTPINVSPRTFQTAHVAPPS